MPLDYINELYTFCNNIVYPIKRSLNNEMVRSVTVVYSRKTETCFL